MRHFNFAQAAKPFLSVHSNSSVAAGEVWIGPESLHPIARLWYDLHRCEDWKRIIAGLMLPRSAVHNLCAFGAGRCSFEELLQFRY